jgi:hypothetical protein
MISRLVQHIAASSLQKNNLVGGQQDLSDGNLLVILLTLIVLIAILLVVGKYIWNEVLVQLIPGIKPLENVTQLLLLWFLINILFCCK